MVGVQRILDIDLDFFVTPVVYWPEDNERPPAEDYSVWPIDQALDFLRNRCGLTQKLPGFVTENHGELSLYGAMELRKACSSLPSTSRTWMHTRILGWETLDTCT
ncbi:hypothetical protein [Rhodococcus qingshengii]|uniref:hypothetical protein n=1 Tax=Rhodococcus qingshengii TaxID=334542 RepID=UPI00211E692F|nr:hypothetical protein [Rhodococcus qingshengii]